MAWYNGSGGDTFIRRVAKNGRLLASLQLSFGGHDLSSRESSPARTAEAGAHQESSAWPLGIGSWAVLNLGPPEPADRKYDLNVIYVSGPGHGAPATLANSYLEGHYSEIYPDKSRDEAGMLKFFRQFSFPGGIGSHCTPETPGSIHEGGELGYSISHAYGAAFDNPDLIVAVAVGDGEAETGPLATSWHSNKFLNPIRDGAVFPILHLNGYKIANPDYPRAYSAGRVGIAASGYGHKPYFVEGDDPATMHQKMAATLEQCILEIRSIQQHARVRPAIRHRPRWPMIVLRSPKGWTGPKEVDGHKVEDFWRAHQVPVLDPVTNKNSLRIVEDWMRSYKPEELFDAKGTLVAELQELAPAGDAPHLREPARERRPAAKDARTAGLSRLRRRSESPGRDICSANRCPGALSCRSDAPQHELLSASSDRTRPRPTNLRPSTRLRKRHGWPNTSRKTQTAANLMSPAA